jgi:uncharacterized protein (DUF342 family)
MQVHICLDAQDHTLYAELRGSEVLEEVSVLSITEKLEEAGYPDLSLDPHVMSQLLASVQEKKECKIPLKSLVDATVSVEIASDKLQASLTLTAADGGQPLTFDMISYAIAEAGIEESLVDQAMVADCYQRQSVTNVGIAQARLPVNGKDAEYVPLVKSEIIAPPDVDDHGVADMGNTHQFLWVDVGTPLMRHVPATKGEAGIDVTGEEIKPVSGKDAGFAKKLTGVVISVEDPHMLVAEIKGHPVFVKNGVNVDPVLHVDNVDVHTGNIRFDGSLEVKGDVAVGMTIDVTGDVLIRGAVERASIKAGQNIRVGGGILGGEDIEGTDENNLEYRIDAGADIEAKFVNLSTLKAKNNIVVKEYIINSFVKAGNRLVLGQPNGKGVLFGGKSEAVHRAVIKQVGNKTYMPTQLTVGQLSKIYTVYQQLKKELAARLNEIGQLESILEKVTQNNIAVFGKMSVDKTTKIENTIVAIKEKVSRIQQQLQALEPEIELQKKATIKVTRAIYPNAVLTINDTTKRFSTQTRGNTWVQSGDELVEQKKKEESHAC